MVVEMVEHLLVKIEITELLTPAVEVVVATVVVGIVEMEAQALP